MPLPTFEVHSTRGAAVLLKVMRLIAAAGFVTVGIKHFTNAAFFEQIIPPAFPAKGWLVAVSGACEIAGGLGLLVRPLRRAAGWGLIALLVAVFPANVYMALNPDAFHLAPWLLWLRLPLQGLFIGWVWFVARDGGRKKMIDDER